VKLLENFLAFYVTRSFISVFTRALQWSLSWARWIRFIPPQPIDLKSVLILSTHLRGLCNTDWKHNYLSERQRNELKAFLACLQLVHLHLLGITEENQQNTIRIITQFNAPSVFILSAIINKDYFQLSQKTSEYCPNAMFVITDMRTNTSTRYFLHDCHTSTKSYMSKHTCKKNSMVWVRERTIPTERPPLVGEVIANLWG
jgi:hypothetical protein